MSAFFKKIIIPVIFLFIILFVPINSFAATSTLPTIILSATTLRLNDTLNIQIKNLFAGPSASGQYYRYSLTLHQEDEADSSQDPTLNFGVSDEPENTPMSQGDCYGITPTGLSGELGSFTCSNESKTTGVPHTGNLTINTGNLNLSADGTGAVNFMLSIGQVLCGTNPCEPEPTSGTPTNVVSTTFTVSPNFSIGTISPSTVAQGDKITISILNPHIPLSSDEYTVSLLNNSTPPTVIAGSTATPTPCNSSTGGETTTCDISYTIPNISHIVGTQYNLQVMENTGNIDTKLIPEKNPVTSSTLIDGQAAQCPGVSTPCVYATAVYHNNYTDDCRLLIQFKLTGQNLFDSSTTNYKLSLVDPNSQQAAANQPSPPQLLGSFFLADPSGIMDKNKCGALALTYPDSSTQLTFGIQDFNLPKTDVLYDAYNYNLTYNSNLVTSGTLSLIPPLEIADASTNTDVTELDSSGSYTLTLHYLSIAQPYSVWFDNSTNGMLFHTAGIINLSGLVTAGYTIGTTDKKTITVALLDGVTGAKNLCLTNEVNQSDAASNVPLLGSYFIDPLSDVLSGNVYQDPCTFPLPVTVGAAPTPTPSPTPPLPPCAEYQYTNGDPVPTIYIATEGAVVDQSKVLPSPYQCAEVDTAFGTFGTDVTQLIGQLFAVILSIAGAIVLASIIYSGYRIMTSNGNAETIKLGRERITGAIIGLLFIIFSLVLLQFIGVDILSLPGFGQ